jgi:hypothetical protein
MYLLDDLTNRIFVDPRLAVPFGSSRIPFTREPRLVRKSQAIDKYKSENARVVSASESHAPGLKGQNIYESALSICPPSCASVQPFLLRGITSRWLLSEGTGQGSDGAEMRDARWWSNDNADFVVDYDNNAMSSRLLEFLLAFFAIATV